jgi:iron(III) transport system ATP-binding protein
VDDVSFSVSDGELITLLGPSGCGKTTVLRMVAGLERPTHGKITLGDIVLSDEKAFLPPHLRGIGMVFQSYALWPHRTVAANVAFPLEIQKFSKEEIARKVEEALKLVALDKLGHRFPHELSGGQQQRVALARAIAQKPRVLLLDEPLSNLDAKLREQMRRELKTIQRELGLTMLYVTHDRLEALELSHRMAIMDHGKLVQFGTPDEIVKNPANEFVAHFIK